MKLALTPIRSRGFTYLMVLAAVVIVGVLAEAAHLSTWRIVQADREAELLFRGMAYRRAIEGFYKANGMYPRELEDLLKDPKVSGRSHMRALYLDPMAAGENKQWALVHAVGGGIAGVVSRSEEEPLKKANFPKGYEKFANAKSYRDWLFEYIPPPAAPPRPGQRAVLPPGKPASAR